MKKRYFIFLLFIFYSFLANGQKPSGYMGKRFSVTAGYGFNPFLIFDITNRKNFKDVNNSGSPNGDFAEYSASAFPGLSSRFFVNLEYTFMEYKSVGIELANHNNIIVLETQDIGMLGNPILKAFKLHCNSIAPYMRFYKKNMTPAPLGNFFTLGVNYTMVTMDSAKAALNNFPASDLYQSNGKVNFWDLYLGTGRSFMIAKKAIFRLEFGMPYIFKCLLASLSLTNNRSVSLDEINYDTTALSKGIKKKIALNNWFVYNLSIGIPF